MAHKVFAANLDMAHSSRVMTQQTDDTKMSHDEALSPAERAVIAGVFLAVQRILPPIIIICGVVGNIFSFLVLRQPRYAKQLTCFYMRCLSVFDSYLLLAHVILRTTMNYHPEFMLGPVAGPVVCPMLMFVALNFYGLSNWTIVTMSCDRFIAVRFPLKAALWCTMKRARVTVAAIFIVCFSLQVPNLFRTLDTTGTITKGICPFRSGFFPSWFVNEYYTFYASFSMATPFSFIALINVCIVCTLVQTRVRAAELTKTLANRTGGHVTVLLFLVTLVFFITNLPWAIDQWATRFILDSIKLTSGRANIIRKLIYETIAIFVFINPAANFYIYCLGCKKFRKDLQTVVRSLYLKCSVRPT
jgi:hypothetical protein